MPRKREPPRYACPEGQACYQAHRQTVRHVECPSCEGCGVVGEPEETCTACAGAGEMPCACAKESEQ